MRDKQIDRRHFSQKFRNLPLSVVIGSIFLVARSTATATQPQTMEGNRARMEILKSDFLRWIVVSRNAEPRNSMAHVAYVIESSIIDISQREDQVVRVRRELRHPKAVRRMDVSYRVNAKLLRVHASQFSIR